MKSSECSVKENSYLKNLKTIPLSDREVTVRCWYPDTAINRKGFNPVI